MKGITLFIALTVSGSAMAQYTIFAAETVAGSLGSNVAGYGGVQRYDVSLGGVATMGTGIPASTLHDAIGLKFKGNKLYVSNRHGNTLGAGSIQVFDWNGSQLTGGSTIISVTSSPFQGFHGFDIAPNGDIFVTSVNGGTRRFRDSGSGFVDIGGTSNGAVRDALVSPDGTKLFETTTDNRLLITSIATNSLGATTSFTVNGANAMHQMTLFGGSIYVTSCNSSSVHRVILASDYTPTSSSIVANASAAIGITFGPTGEMFIPGHTSNITSRFQYNGSAWVANGTIATGHNMGFVAATPGPVTMSGLVNLNGYTGTAPGSATLPLTFTLLNPMTHAVLQGPTPVNVTPISGVASYWFIVNPGISGSVEVVCQGATWLRRKVTATVGATNVNMNLVNGNVNGDNVIDLTDYTVLVTAFNGVFGSAPYLAPADLNKDGVIDLSDYTILVTNFNATDD